MRPHAPLPGQRRRRAHYLVLCPAIDKARGDPLDQAGRAIPVPQQQYTGFGGHHPAVERRHHAAASQAFNLERFEGASVRVGPRASNLASVCSATTIPRLSGPVRLLPWDIGARCSGAPDRPSGHATIGLVGPH
jgi:hypothetical protein